MSISSLQVSVAVTSSIEKVWEYWTKPEHITKWYVATDTWHTPRAENDLRVEGKFTTRMEAKDGSEGFDFWGTYDVVEVEKRLSYTLGDGRAVDVRFSEHEGEVRILQVFDAEEQNPIEMQRAGWQAILNNFKKYVEGN